jgi:membrane-associated phospholipid phosphatase
VSLGAHFPADVMGGFLSGPAVVLLIYVALQKLTWFVEVRFRGFQLKYATTIQRSQFIAVSLMANSNSSSGNKSVAKSKFIVT